jgi:hypothetical protein
VLASVLSPHFAGDLRYSWWWRNLARLLLDGQYSVHGAQGAVIRRSIANYAHGAAPHFELEGVFVGRPSAQSGPRRRVDTHRRDHLARWRTTTSRYMFLLFRKP